MDEFKTIYARDSKKGHTGNRTLWQEPKILQVSKGIAITRLVAWAIFHTILNSTDDLADERDT